MNREKLSRKIEQVQTQITSLQAQLSELEEQKAAADLAEGQALLQRRKISPEDLKFLISMSEEEKKLILKKRVQAGTPSPAAASYTDHNNEDFNYE